MALLSGLPGHGVVGAVVGVVGVGRDPGPRQELARLNDTVGRTRVAVQKDLLTKRMLYYFWQ